MDAKRRVAQAGQHGDHVPMVCGRAMTRRRARNAPEPPTTFYLSAMRDSRGLVHLYATEMETCRTLMEPLCGMPPNDTRDKVARFGAEAPPGCLFCAAIKR